MDKSKLRKVKILVNTNYDVFPDDKQPIAYFHKTIYHKPNNVYGNILIEDCVYAELENMEGNMFYLHTKYIRFID